ncbi:MAG: ATP-binding protein [Candidatus Marinarcus sp.]|uniref:HAMP domain-containing sensor histidine kinase n=1 Tax=Candidatus Marinarcus sp. TaxID=3100987 RepID=UPI003AFFFCA0
MIKNNSLKTALLIPILTIIVLGIGTIFYFSYHDLKKEIDIAQEQLYSEKIDNIIFLINQKYQTLLKTQMKEAYEERFKESTLEIIKKVFDKGKESYPFIIDENRVLVLHKVYNKENVYLYQNKPVFLKITKEKNGNFDILKYDNNRWIIFKYFEPWDWIVGYRVNQEHKYKELYAFEEEFLAISFVILLFISLLILLIVRKTLKPIDNLSNVSKEITSGNLNAEIEVLGVKELKILSENFRRMRDKISEDITQLKVQEEKIKAFNSELQEEVRLRTKELETEKEVFETLFNDAYDGVSLYKKDRFIACNQALVKMLGCESKEAFLKMKREDVSPVFQPNGQKSSELANKHIQKCLNEGSAQFEWMHKKVNGEEFWAEIVLTRIVIDNEALVHGVWRNIQDKKALELEIENKNIDLQEYNDELEVMIENLRITQNKLVESEKLASLGSLVSGVAHQISPPLGLSVTVASHLDYLYEEANEKFTQKCLKEEECESYLNSSTSLVKSIVSNLTKMEKIVENFKQVAIDQTSEQKRLFKVKEYIRGILISIEHLTKQRNIEFNIECDDMLEITSFPGFFVQIITHLVSNSLEHAYNQTDKGMIFISVSKNAKNLMLKYRDDGKGISKKNLSKIYEPFFSTKTENATLGLGLNVVYNLVTTNLKGSITCESQEGKGTMFKIEIPL